MDFAKSDIQLMLLDSAERLLGERAGVEYWREQRESALGFDSARWAQFAELGWLALPLPEEAGGLAGSIEDVALLNIELGRALATEPYVSTVVLGAHLIAQGAPEDQAADLLGRVAAGSLGLALAHREAAHDPLGPTPIATRAGRQGDGYRLSGTKMMALDAPSADMLIVSATMEGEDGTALFLVDVQSDGVTLDAYALVDGTRAADILLRDVALPADALIVGGNAGAALLGETLDRATIAMFAQAVGSMEACIKICGAYTNERKQFGTAIGSFQAIQHILADMFVAANQARSMLYHAISSSYGDPTERASALSAAAIVIGEAGQLVARNGIQVHGGYGLTDEYAISHHYRRLMSIEKLHGDVLRHTRRLGDQIFAAA